jgi:hypothetical protein
MPLSIKDASQLKSAIGKTDSIPVLTLAKLEWNDFLKESIDLNGKTFDEYLIALRQKSLDRKSYMVQVDMDGKTKDIRFYPDDKANVNIDTNDFFARGIDSLRAVLEICQHAKINDGDNQLQTAFDTYRQKSHALNIDYQNTVSSLHEHKKQINEYKDALIKHKKGGLEDRLGEYEIKTYKNNIKTLKTQLKELQEEQKALLKQAKKDLNQFNGALSDFLITNNLITFSFNTKLSRWWHEHKIVNNNGIDTDKRILANNAINFVRDYLFKRDISTAFCTEESVPGKENMTMLRFSTPKTFAEKSEIHRKGEGKPFNPWNDYQNQPWYKKLAAKVGGKGDASWLAKFMDAHSEQMKTLSSTPMQRFTPNPANAFDCTDIIIENDEVVQTNHHSKIAISEPLSVGGTKSRQDITDWNHFSLVTKHNLTDLLNSHMERWGQRCVNNENEIDYTLLHQTLIGDEVSFTPDQTKAKRSQIEGSVIDSKLVANKAMRKFFKQNDVYRLKDDIDEDNKAGKIVIVAKDKAAKYSSSGDWQKVNIHLLETNDCINTWHLRARIRDNDIAHSRKLVSLSAAHLQSVLGNEDEDVNKIIRFLNSTNYSLIWPYKKRRDGLKDAIKSVTDELLSEEGKYKSLDKNARRNLALGLQAAVNLKTTVNETLWGAARRKIGNFSRNHIRSWSFIPVISPVIGHLIDWSIRGTLAVVAAVTKLSFNVLTFGIPFFISLFNHKKDRKTVYKAAYEGIVTDSLLGSFHGGCMSSADRANEMAESRAAMTKQFAAEGKIIGFNDTPKEKEAFLTTYASTKNKHVSVEMATGIAATKDGETKGLVEAGLMSQRETKEEQTLSKMASSLRKGKFDDKVKIADYIAPKPQKDSKAKPKVRQPSEEVKKTIESLSELKERLAIASMGFEELRDKFAPSVDRNSKTQEDSVLSKSV